MIETVVDQFVAIGIRGEADEFAILNECVSERSDLHRVPARQVVVGVSGDRAGRRRRPLARPRPASSGRRLSIVLPNACLPTYAVEPQLVGVPMILLVLVVMTGVPTAPSIGLRLPRPRGASRQGRG